MGVHDVERAAGAAEVVDVAGLEPDVGLPGGGLAGGGEHVSGRVDADDLAGPGGQAGSDGAGTAADIQHPVAGPQPRQQVAS